MPPVLRQSRSMGGEDIYFEPIDTQNPSGYNVEIKQDIISDDGYPQTSIEDEQRKSWIGAYKDTKAGLPAEKGFPIQIGSELFRLSGASIMSDAPSYFSRFFEDQIRSSDNYNGSMKTLYIDRDPETFKDIARHLQGYHIHPQNGQHFVKLFSDAQFYSLPRLNKQLFESDIHIRIAEQDFKFSRDVFSSPGDSPNYFSLGFGLFPNHNGELYPGLDREGLIRPPPAEAPEIQNRSASTFADLLQLLRGYPLHIRDAEHRAELLRDCRYYNFKGLEQKIIFHHISFNSDRRTHEILLRIEDLRQPGISIHFPTTTPPPPTGIVQYARPFADDHARDLIVETGDESSRFNLNTLRIEFFNNLDTRMTSLLQVLTTKLSSSQTSLSPTTGASNLQISLSKTTHILLDGEEFDHFAHPLLAPDLASVGISSGEATKKRKLGDTLDGSHDEEFWLIKRGQWRIELQPVSDGKRQGGAGVWSEVDVVLHAIKLDAVSGERGRNRARGFLVG